MVTFASFVYLSELAATKVEKPKLKIVFSFRVKDAQYVLNPGQIQGHIALLLSNVGIYLEGGEAYLSRILKQTCCCLYFLWFLGLL